MGYRVLIGTVAIECDSVEEALEIAKRAGELEGKPPGRLDNLGERGGAGSRWTDARVADFLRLLKGQQRKVIDALLEHQDGRTDEQLLQLLGMDDGRKLAGVLTGLLKNARKVGGDPKDLYSKHPVTIGDRRVHEYLLTDPFRKAVGRMKGKL